MYHLVHIVSNEHKTPLIASMVFDRAQEQATLPGKDKPSSVSVWLIAPFRELFDKETKEIKHAMKKRCPDVKVKVLGGINRFKNWPIHLTLRTLRASLKGNVVYHCRGEQSIPWAHYLKTLRPTDSIILDVRGYYPDEHYFTNHQDIVEEQYMTDADKQVYQKDIQRLKKAITDSDCVVTVSNPLRGMLIKNAGAHNNTIVVPCCVKDIIQDTNREKIRALLNIQNKTAILYLGGTQKYQFLDELVIPFIKAAVSFSDKYVGVFITQNKDKMQSLLKKFDIDEQKMRLISLKQNEVADYLSAIDIGLLLREPSIINKPSQPVKLGEYLSAGLPVIVEKGTGDVPELLSRYNMGYTVELTDKKGTPAFDEEVRNALEWFENNGAPARTNAREFVESHYTWKANVPLERAVYVSSLNR